MTAPQNDPVSVAAVAGSPSSPVEERILHVRAAGFARRALAAAIDLLLVCAITAGVTLAAAVLLGLRVPMLRQLGPDLLVAGVLDRSPLALGALGLLLGLSALYQIYFGGISGQTLGKRLCGLRVISSRGTPPGPVWALLRFVGMAVSLAPAGLGWLWAAFDRERRALHDHMAGTYVIVDRFSD